MVDAAEVELELEPLLTLRPLLLLGVDVQQQVVDQVLHQQVLRLRGVSARAWAAQDQPGGHTIRCAVVLHERNVVANC